MSKKAVNINILRKVLKQTDFSVECTVSKKAVNINILRKVLKQTDFSVECMVSKEYEGCQH